MITKVSIKTLHNEMKEIETEVDFETKILCIKDPLGNGHVTMSLEDFERIYIELHKLHYINKE